MKKTMLKRTIAAALAAASAMMLFAGCGGKTTDGDVSSSGGDSDEYVYVASYKELGITDYISTGSADIYDGKLYYAASVASSVTPDGVELTEDDEDYWTYYSWEPGLFVADLESGDAEQLLGYAPPQKLEGSMGGASVDGLVVASDGAIWVAEDVSSYHYDVPDGITSDDDEYWDYYVDDGTQRYLRKLDSTGAEVLSVDISNMSGNSEYFYIDSFVIDDSGNLYVSDGDTSIYVYDSNGQELFTLTTDNYIYNMVRLSDGTIAAGGYFESGTGARRIDTTAKAWGETLEMPSSAYNIYNGGGDYLFYCSTSSILYGYNTATGECEKILNWIDVDVDEDYLMYVSVDQDGTVSALTRNYTNDGTTTELVTLTRAKSSEVTQKITLTYACVYLNWNVRSQIIEFNKTSDKYHIEVNDYSEYNTDDDYSAGLTKLTTEIIAGNIPDLLAVDELPIEQYAATGLLEDLYPYMDADSELSRSAFVPSVLSALETDGKLYQMGSSFSISTVIGDPAVVGSESGWTLDELNAVLDEHPDSEVFDYYTTRDDVLTTACAYSMDDFVDWTTGECSFDSDGFVKLLEFCKRFQAEFNWDTYEYDDESDTPNRVMTGKQLLIQTNISDFEEFQMYKAMFGGNIVYKGFPCENKNGNALQISGGIAMTTSCKDKEGGWEFIRSMLTEDYQESVWSFPTNQAAFDSQLAEAMEADYYTDEETGEQIEESKGSWGWGSLDVEIYAIKQDEADEITNMINSVTNVYSYDESITDIVKDEAAAFFNGEKTAEETAKLIQSRVKLYVNEKR